LEGAQHFIRDCKLANRLGIKALRASWPPYPPDDPADANLAPYAWSTPAIQTIEKALPYAEKYDVRIGVELHSPTDLKSKLIDKCMDFITRTNTKHFGFCPDMSIFTKRPPESMVMELIRDGGRENIIRHIIQAYQNNLGPDKTVDEVKKMNGNEVELEFAGIGGIYHYCWNEPRELAKILPYSYHFHAKFWDMTDDLCDPCIPYEDVIPVIVSTGYDWYFSSEYEGPRNIFEASKSIRKQQLMIRRLLETPCISR